MPPAQQAGQSNRPLPKVKAPAVKGNAYKPSQDATNTNQAPESLPLANNTPAKPATPNAATKQSPGKNESSEVNGKQIARSVGKADGAFFEALVDQILSSATDREMPVVQLADGIKPGFGSGKFTELAGEGEITSEPNKVAGLVSAKITPEIADNVPKPIVAQFQPAQSGESQHVVLTGMGSKGLLASVNKPQTQDKAVDSVKGKVGPSNAVQGKLIGDVLKPANGIETQVQTQPVAVSLPKTTQVPNQVVEADLKVQVAVDPLQGILRPDGSQDLTHPATSKTTPKPRLKIQPQFSELGKFKLNGLSADPQAVEAIVAQAQQAGSKPKLPFAVQGQFLQSVAGLDSQAETALAAQSIKSAATPASAEPISQQIAMQIQARPIKAGQQITVQLNPPELGKVNIEIRQDDQGLRAILEVENPRTFSQLQREAPGLVNRLVEGGVQVNRIEINLTNSSDTSDRSASDPFGSMMRDNFSNQQDSQAGDTGKQSESGYTDGYGLDESDESLVSAGYVNDEAINVWR